MLQRRVGREDGVVGLHDGGGHLRCRVDGKLELRLLAIVDGEALHQQGSESGSGASTKRVEDEEALETGALIGVLTETIEHDVDDLFADGIMTASVVVRRILFT